MPSHVEEMQQQTRATFRSVLFHILAEQRDQKGLWLGYTTCVIFYLEVFGLSGHHSHRKWRKGRSDGEGRNI